MRQLRKEEYLRKTENLDSARTWRLDSQWGVVDSHSAAVRCCSRPMVGLFYKAVPVLADEDKIGGSAILAQPERACPNVMPQYCTGQSASCFLDSGACKERHYPDQTKGDRQAVGASRALALGKAINGYGAGCALTSSDNQGAATSSGAGSCLHGCGCEWCRLVQLRPRVRPTSQGRPHLRRWRTVQRGRRFH